MAAPCINIESVSRYKISNVSGMNESIVYFFSSDQVLKDFIAKAAGVSHDTGVTVGKLTTYILVKHISEETYILAYIPIGTFNGFEVLAVNSVEMEHGINICGMNEGEWTAYGLILTILDTAPPDYHCYSRRCSRK